MESGPRRVRLTLRLRLTLLYGACFLTAGAVLLGITYGLVRNDTVSEQGHFFVRAGPLLAGVPIKISAGGVQINASGSGRNFSIASQSKRNKFTRQPPVTQPPVTQLVPKPLAGRAPAAVGVQLRQIQAAGQRAVDTLTREGRKRILLITKRANIALDEQRSQSLSTLLTWFVIALAVMAVLSIGLGWLLAGRALRPLRTMNARAREITEESLHERLGMEGRTDELGELAATFDALLARLERAFDAQRRFVANASHELRTPLTLERALVEVALEDPDASVESLRRCCERVLVSGAQQERVIDALLTLARSQAGIEGREEVDLRAIAEEMLAARAFQTAGVEVEAKLDPAVVNGDAALLERLVANLLDNAITHNVEGGWIRIDTGSGDGQPTLRIANSGSVIPDAAVEELFEPFRRLDGERTAGGDGLGLGLSIVRAIAVAHDAALHARPLPEGGLDVELRFAAAPGRVTGDEALRADAFSVHRA